jgi:hypothetical protein
LPSRPENGAPEVTNLADVVEHVFPLLKFLGPYISSDAMVLCKLCRVLASLCNTELSTTTDAQQETLMTVIGNVTPFSAGFINPNLFSLPFLEI